MVLYIVSISPHLPAGPVRRQIRSLLSIAGTKSFRGMFPSAKSLKKPENSAFSGRLTTNPTIKIRKGVHLFSFGVHSRMDIAVQSNLYVGMAQDLA